MCYTCFIRGRRADNGGRKMTATEFYKAFLRETDESKICEDGRTLLEIYKTDADYTKVVMKIINI